MCHILTSHGDKDGDRAELRAPSSLGWPPKITPFEDSKCTMGGSHVVQCFSLSHEPYLDGSESTMTLRKKSCGVIGNGNPAGAENVPSNLRIHACHGSQYALLRPSSRNLYDQELWLSRTVTPKLQYLRWCLVGMTDESANPSLNPQCCLLVTVFTNSSDFALPMYP